MPSPEPLKQILPRLDVKSWYPTQAETLQRQRDQLAESKQQASDFSKAGTTGRRIPWWTRVFWRI